MKRYILFIVLCIIQFHLFAQQIITIGIDSIDTQSYTPRRSVEQLGNSIIVTYNFDNVLLSEDALFADSYNLYYKGFGTIDESGKPALPFHSDAFSISGSASIEIIDTSYIDLSIKLAPARKPLSDNEYTTHTLENTDTIAPYTGFYPNDILTLNSKQCYRDNGIVRVNITPLQYDMENATVRAYNKIKYKINIEDVDVDYVNQPITDSQDYFINNNTINKSIEQQRITNNSISINKDYLILSSSQFEDICNTFANWKRTMGYRTHILLRDDWTTTSVQSAIKNLYETDNIKLYYLLIIGDENIVPPIYKTNIYDGNEYIYATDLLYGCMDGPDDLIPDIYRGRIPVSTVEDASIVIDKIINYEKNPIIDSLFYKTGVNCAFFQDYNKDGFADRRFAQTAEEIRNYLLNQNKIVNRVYCTDSTAIPTNWNKGIYSYGETIPMELQKPNFSWDGDSNNILDNINSGTFYVLHRDHGGVLGWGDPSFDNSNIQSLQNGSKLPIVFSINCLTGKYNSNSCFAEKFLTKTGGGCVGIFAATEISFSGYNDAFVTGMFDAIWPDPGLIVHFPRFSQETTILTNPIYELGAILEQGMQRMEDTYGYASCHSYTRSVFHCFGDPSMQIYTETPQYVATPQIFKNRNTIYIDIPDGDARITFYTPSTGKVDTYWGSNITYTTNDSNVNICISRHNFIPYISNSEDLVYIQNESINENRIYNAKQIKLGSHVTSKIENGNVIFNSGNTVINSKKTIFAPGTIIKNGSTLTVTNNY